MRAMTSSDESESGLAGGQHKSSAQVGGALGLAVLATLAASKTQSLRALGNSAPDALTGGFRMVFGLSAALLIAAFVIAVIVLRDQPADAGVTERAEDAA